MRSAAVSDPELAARNRVERDRLVAEDAGRQGRRLGVRVIEVDGGCPADAAADADDRAPEALPYFMDIGPQDSPGDPISMK